MTTAVGSLLGTCALLALAAAPCLGCSSSDESGATESSGAGNPGVYETARVDCLDAINGYRGTVGVAAYARWTDAESCTDGQAEQDGTSGAAHGAFGQCGESAQDECPGWPGPPEAMITSCLAQMWAEGPGDDFATHGHYINMSNASYTQAACGFHVFSDGSVWATQNFK